MGIIINAMSWYLRDVDKMAIRSINQDVTLDSLLFTQDPSSPPALMAVNANAAVPLSADAFFPHKLKDNLHV